LFYTFFNIKHSILSRFSSKFMNKIKPFLLSEKTYSFLIAAVLISLPLRHAFSNTTVIILLAVSLASVFYHKISFKKEQLIPVFFYVFMAVSLLWSVDLKESVRGLERHLIYMMIPVLFITMPIISKKVLLKAFYYFSVGIAIFTVLFIVYATTDYFINGNSMVFFYHDLVKVTPLKLNLNAIYISVIVAFVLLFMIFYSKRKPFNFVVTFLLVLFLILLSSKNVFITTLIAAGIGLLLTKKIVAKHILFLVIFGLGLFAIILFSPLKQRIDNELSSNIEEVLTKKQFTRIYPWTGTTIRLVQARIGVELIKENNKYLTGFGINASRGKIREKQHHYNMYSGYNKYNFHNQYIQAYVELGVIGLLFVLALLVIVFKFYLKEKELIYLFFFILMASIFITESFIWRQRGMIFFLLIYGLLLKVSWNKQNTIDL